MNPLLVIALEKGVEELIDHLKDTEPMNAIELTLLKTLVDALLGDQVFERVLARVEAWAEKEITNLEKHSGVVADLEIIGLKLTESAANFAIEAAVQHLQRAVK